METLYSKVIWNKLGMKDYQIYNRPHKETDDLIVQWIKDTPLDEVLELINELSLNDMCTSMEMEVDYYDGFFHSIKTTNNELYFHDTNILPIVMVFFIKFPQLIQEIDLIKRISEECYNKKIRNEKEKER